MRFPAASSRAGSLPAQVYDSVVDLIGDTPLIEVRVSARRAARVFGKLESANPGGSVKDRICLRMIERAEAEGKLGPGGVVVEPTSGNTGIGLALVAVQRGYRCILTMPESMSLERRQLLESLGAELVLTPAEEQMAGALRRALQIAEETPSAFVPSQFDNPSNPLSHYDTTAEEILHALQGAVPDAFVACVGTGGTVSGVGRKLKEQRSDCRVFAVEPESCATLSRGERGPTKIQGIGAGFVPANFDPSVVDEIRTISDARAWSTKQSLAREQGLLVGVSAGANVAVAGDVAEELGPGHTVVTVLCDTGERYFSLGEYFQP